VSNLAAVCALPAKDFAISTSPANALCEYSINIFPSQGTRRTNMMKGGIGNMMKQVQQVQENMAKMQARLAEIEIEGQSGAGMVKVVMTCKYDVRRVAIDPSLMGDDKEMLEDLVAAAVNDAVRKVESTVQEKMGSVTAGLPIPPGMKLPF